MSGHHWTQDNAITLLENGEEFFPVVLEDIRAAHEEVILETFIWLDDKVGRALRAALVEAASNGASVDVTVDGHGSASLEKSFVKPLTDAGGRLHVYGPMPPKLGMQPNLLHRMHRKIVVIDCRIAYIGGINFSDAHMRYSGADSKQDYAAKVVGPVVNGIRSFCFEALGTSAEPPRKRLRDLMQRMPMGRFTPQAGAQALFVTRDNHRHRHDIEAMYLVGLHRAQRDIIIMCSYFFPSHRFLRAMEQAIKRGARLRLILQGTPDKGYVKFAGETLYDHLLDIGVEIWEYTERPSHAKVAVIDDDWATIGSSNLDPLSLALNLEANLLVRDKAFNHALRGSLERILNTHARQVQRHEIAQRHPIWRLWRGLAFHLLRYFPKLVRLIPVKTSRLATIKQPQEDLGPGDRSIGHADQSRD